MTELLSNVADTMMLGFPSSEIVAANESLTLNVSPGGIMTGWFTSPWVLELASVNIILASCIGVGPKLCSVAVKYTRPGAVGYTCASDMPHCTLPADMSTKSERVARRRTAPNIVNPISIDTDSIT